jgi:hypothetical protein
MPEILHVRVAQTRVVVVTANSLADAIAIATAKFDDTDKPLNADGSQTFGYALTEATVTNLTADLE